MIALFFMAVGINGWENMKRGGEFYIYQKKSK